MSESVSNDFFGMKQAVKHIDKVNLFDLMYEWKVYINIMLS